MEFSPQQKQSMDLIRAWYKSKEQIFVLAGYAGTGKSTMAKYIADKIGGSEVVFCSYTGKAAKVLRDKGCPNSGTIHSFLYSYLNTDRDRKPVFGWNPVPVFMNAKLIVVDEYSMLGDEILHDLLRTGKKILFLGDPFQLPPVKGRQTKMKPNFFLEEVHRQALDSPILKAATDVRLGNRLQYCDFGGFKFIPANDVDEEIYINASQIICGKNDTRHQINDFLRGKKGFDSDLKFVVGDKLICLQNSKKNGLLNGMIGECTSVDFDGGCFYLDFVADGVEYKELKVFKGDVSRTREVYDYRSGMERFDFGYAITCHKSQGSEFDNVLIYSEPFGTEIERRRWTYTAITRGVNQVTMVG